MSYRVERGFREVVLGLGLVLATGLGLSGCLGVQDSPGGDAEQTETVRFANDGDVGDTIVGDASDVPPAPDGEEDTTLTEDLLDDSDGGVTTEDVPVAVSADTVAHSNEIAGRWRCSSIVENGEEAFEKETTMTRLPSLTLDEDGTGTLFSEQGDVPVKWSSTGDLARIERAIPIDADGTGDGLSGQAWITRNGAMIWHADGDPDDMYTRWITEDAANAIVESAPTSEMVAEEDLSASMQ